MKTILCYGDSNTWGFVGGSINFDTMYMERYPYDKRWTGILQSMLKNKYHVIEEGLNGRTTNVDYKELYGRNGKTFLPVCLYTHSPLDLVILMLGTNDLKKEFNRSVNDIANGIEELIQIIQSSKYGSDMQSSPKILLVSPATVINETYSDDMFKDAIARSKEFAKEYQKIASKYGCEFIDADRHITVTEVDGLHFDEKAHEKFADIIYKKLNSIEL